MPKHDSKNHEVLSQSEIFLDHKLVLLIRLSSKTEMLDRVQYGEMTYVK